MPVGCQVFLSCQPFNREFALDLLAAAIASGRVHLASPDGDDPEEAEAWGWTKVEVGTGQYRRTEWQPQGLRVGWIEDGNVYLEAEAAYAEVQKLARDGEDSLSVSLATLKRRLKEKGLLASTEKAAEREWLEVRRALQGQRRRVLHLKAEALISENWSHWSQSSQPSQELYSAVPQIAPINVYQSPVSTEEWSQDVEPEAGASVCAASGGGSIGSNGSKIPDTWSPRTATGLPEDGNDEDNVWPALDEQIEVLLDELDNALRRWRQEHNEEAQQQVRWLEGQLNVLGASVLIPLREPHDPKLPVSQIEVCQDLATLSRHPSLVAAVSPDHQPKDGEVVGVLGVGGLRGGHVVREAQVVVFRKSETPAVIGNPEGAHQDPWDPFLEETGDGVG